MTDPNDMERAMEYYGNSPMDDVKDIAQGARFVPSEVTLARRAGQPVRFVQSCSSSVCWYWEFRDVNAGRSSRRRIRDFGPSYYGHPRLDYGYDEFGEPYNAAPSGRNLYTPGQRIYHFERYTYEKIRDKHNGKCPNCGNTHISGVTGNPLEGA